MKIRILALIIVILFSGCASIKKDIDKDKLAKDKADKKNEVSAEAEKEKIAYLERIGIWCDFRYPQNRVQRNVPFTQPYPFGTLYFEMSYDDELVKNYDWIDKKVHEDKGWVQSQKTGLWEEKKTGKVEPVQPGVLYIHTSRKLAIYYYPRRDDRDYDVFKVDIKSRAAKSEVVKTEPAKTNTKK
jgi:hypothetical protein